MRLGHVTTEYKPIRGGAETYLANLHEILSEEGWTQTVYQFNNGVREPGLRLLPHQPKFSHGRASDLWWFNLALHAKFNALRKDDVLICHYAFHSWPLWWKKRVIVLSHGCEWDIPPTSLSQRLKIKIARWSFRHFKYLVANDTNYFRQMGVDITPKEKMFQEVLPGKWFIPNCVNTDVFRPTAPAKDFPPHTILVVRNISRPRGIHLAIEAFSLFAKDFPATSLVIVGSCFDEPYRRELMQIIERAELGDKVIFKGGLDWSKLPSVYAAAEMTVVPTIQREGTSLAALEAMGVGTATVSTNVTGLADLPTTQADPTPEALAQVMKETYQKRQEVAAAQQNAVRQTYNLENWKTAWLKVVRQASAS